MTIYYLVSLKIKQGKIKYLDNIADFTYFVPLTKKIVDLCNTFP